MNMIDDFFVISSDVKVCDKDFSRIYGYVLMNDGTVYNNCIVDDIDEKSILHGGYVLLAHTDKGIEISTDPHGMGMIFYYFKDGYYAISNSLYQLINFLNGKFELTINYEYRDLYMYTNTITTISYTDTFFNEIKILPSNKRIFCKGELFKIKENKEHPLLSLDSDAGFAYLDVWSKKWISIIRSLHNSGAQISVQLSGGFDSRLILSLFIASGINMNDINIQSSTSMTEDYAIAKEIANYYGFMLNGKESSFGYSLASEKVKFDLNNLTRFLLHKEFHSHHLYHDYFKPVFIFTGYGNMRGWFNDSDKKYLPFLLRNPHAEITDSFRASLDRICERIFSDTYERFQGKVERGKNFLNYIYNLTRGRVNYGSAVIAGAIQNQCLLSPILDLTKINPLFAGNDDYDLLFCVIYHKLAKELINFKFDKQRKISEKTKEKAYMLCNSYNDSNYGMDFCIPITYNRSSRNSNSQKNLSIKDELTSSLDIALKKYPDLFLPSYIEKSRQELNSPTIRHYEKNCYAIWQYISIFENNISKYAVK